MKKCGYEPQLDYFDEDLRCLAIDYNILSQASETKPSKPGFLKATPSEATDGSKDAKDVRELSRQLGSTLGKRKAERMINNYPI